ncbi:MAG: phage holin family protein [Sporomusaceae bacterium]|nr:phage holin family protein [Sporomusaceae bacterium]
MDYSQAELRILAVLAAISTAFSFLVGGIDTPIKYFLILTAADYASGMLAGWRTCTLSSSKAFDGIKRKFIILAVVVLANLIDGAAGLGHVLRGTALLTYAVMEGLSILENIDRAGWGEHIPVFLHDRLVRLREERGLQIRE